MATKYLSASANASAATWLDAPGGSGTTAPTTGDDANLNGFTLTIDQTFTCDNIIGATGTLAVSGDRTITANIGNTAAGFGWLLNGASQTVTVNGNIVAGITTTRITLSGATTTLNVNGNITGGTGTNFRGINVSTGTLVLVGNAVGGSGSAASGVRALTGSPTITITGNATGGSAATAAGLTIDSGSPTVVVTGNAQGGTGAVGINIAGAGGTITLTGNILTDASLCSGVAKTATGTTFTYTPTSAQTAIIGGKTMYPTQGGGGGSANLNGGINQ